MSVLAGEAAVRIVPTLKDFHSKVNQGLKRQPHSLEVKVDPNFKEADAQLAAWRARQKAEGINLPVRADFKDLKRDLSQVEHIFKRSAVSDALRLNVKVIGLDALPALAYAAGSAASGLDALGKSAFALPGLLGGALSVAGALATGLHGVSDALKAYGQDSKNAADDAKKQQDADRDLTSAKRNLQSAIRDQKREIEDLNAEMRRSSLNEADAVLSIQEDIDRLRKGGFKSITEYQRAQLSLAQDMDHLSEVRRKNNRTIEDANKANAEGVQGSDRVSDALDRVAKATEALDHSKITKVSEALAKLSPNAQSAVKELHSLKDEFDKVVQAPVQQNLFDGLDQSLKSLGSKTLPILGVGLSGVAKGLNSDLKALATSLGADKNTSLMTKLFGNTQGGLQNASKGVDSLVHSFLQLAAASSNALPRLGDAATKVFGKFDTFIARISNDGTLDKWIDQGLKAVDSLGHSLVNVVSIVSSIGKAFNAASGTQGGFLTSLDHATQKLSEFLKSANGQSDLIEYLKQAKGFVSGLWSAFKDLKPVLKDIVSAARDWSGIMLETVGVLAKVAGWIETNTGLLRPLIELYLTFKTVKPIVEGLTTGWTNYTKVMTAVANQGGIVNATKNGYNELKTSMGNLGKAADETSKKAGSLFSSVKNLAGFMGPGLAFTAALAAGTYGLEQLGKAHEQAAEDARKQAAALDQLKSSLDSVSGAVTRETLQQTAKSAQGYDIPGIGKRNILEDIARTGVTDPQGLLQATNPVNQQQRSDVIGKLDKQTEASIAGSDEWKRFGTQWQENGIDITTMAKAIDGDPDSLGRVRAAQGAMESEEHVGTGKAGQINRMALHAAGVLPGDLTQVLQSSSIPSSATSAIFLRNTSNAFVEGGSGAQAANRAAFGNANLSPEGLSRYGQSEVYVNAQGDGVIVTDRQPKVDPADGQVSPLAGGRWQVTLTDSATSRDIQKFASGGLVKGIGGPTDDMNLVRTSPGEHIARAKAVDYYGPKLFDDLNSMRIPRHGIGGFVADHPAPILPPPGPANIHAGPAPFNPIAALGRPSRPNWSTPQRPVPIPFPGLSTAPSTFPDAVGIEPRHLPSPGIPGASALRGIGAWWKTNASVHDPQFQLNPNLGLNPGAAPAPAPPKPDFGRVNDLLLPPGALTSPGPAKTVGPITPPIPAKTLGVAGNSAFDAYMSSRAGLPADQRAPIDAYWRAKGFNPGEATPRTVKIPQTQAPVTSGPSIPLGNTPIYAAAPGPGGIPQIAPSGPVMGQMRSAIDSLVGTPYVWGGFSPAGVDCSGLASIAANIASGRPAFSSRFATGNELEELTARGFSPGKGGTGTLTIGWNGTHTAITLPDGTAVSSGESGGVAYGGGGSEESQFTNWMHLPVDSGALDALGGLGIPGLGGPGDAGGVPNFLQPSSIMNFLGGQASSIGSGISGIGMGLFSGLTGLNLSPLLGAGQQLGNGLLGELGGGGGSGGATGLNDLAGADINSFLSGNGLPASLGGAKGGGGGTSFTPGGGAEQWRPLVRQVLANVGPKYGVTNVKAWEDAIVKQIGTESGGDPNSTNAHDPTGNGGTQTVKGLLNFLPSTFDANNILGGSIMDPASQIAAAIPYVTKKYGMNQDGSPRGIGAGHGFRSGGYPTGLAYVSAGEYRTNPAATQYYGAGLYNALNSMSIPKHAMGGFAGGIPRYEGGGFGDLLHPPPPPPPFNPGGAPPPTTPQAPQPQQTPGPLPLGQPGMAAAPSTGGPPGPGATAPAPDPGALPQVADALAGLGGAGPGGGAAASAMPQPGAEGTKDADPRGILGAAPASQDHNLPALSQGIQNAAQAAGNAGAMAAAIGSMGMGGGAAGSMISAGAQMGGQAATAAVNILSSLLVGTATNGSTSSASGVPLLPQRSPMQSGVPAINQRNHYGDIHVVDLDEFGRRQQRMDAQDVLPHIGKFG